MGEAAGFEDFPEALSEMAAFEAAEGSPIAEILLYPHVGVERHVLGHVADMTSNLERFAEDVMSCDAGGTGGRGEESGQHPEGGGLTGAIGPEESDDLSFGDFEGNSVDSGVATVVFAEIGNLDHAKIKGRIVWCAIDSRRCDL